MKFQSSITFALIALASGACAAETPHAGAPGDTGVETEEPGPESRGEEGLGEADGHEVTSGIPTGPTALATTDPSGAIASAPRTWSWLDMPESRCANGDPTGIGVNLEPGTDEVMVYLVGGGACWNFATCAIGTGANLRSGYDGADFAKDKISR